MSYKELLNKIIFNRNFEPDFDELIKEYRDTNGFNNEIIKNANYKSLDFHYKIANEVKFNSSDIILACPTKFSTNILFYQYNENKKGYDDINNLFIKYYGEKSITSSSPNSDSLWISLQLINKKTLGEEIRNELNKIIKNIDKKIEQDDLELFSFRKDVDGNVNIFMKEKLFNKIENIYKLYSDYPDPKLIRKDEVYQFFQLLDENKYFDYLSEIDLAEEHIKEKHKPHSDTTKSWRSNIGKIILSRNRELSEIISLVDGKVSWKSTNEKGDLLDDIGTSIEADLDNIYDKDFWDSKLINIVVNKVKFVFKISSEKDKINVPNKILNLYVLCGRSKEELKAIEKNYNDIKWTIHNYKKNGGDIKFSTKGSYNIVQLRTHSSDPKSTYINRGLGNYDTVIRQWCINKDELKNGNALVIDIYKKN